MSKKVRKSRRHVKLAHGFFSKCSDLLQGTKTKKEKKRMIRAITRRVIEQ